MPRTAHRPPGPAVAEPAGETRARGAALLRDAARGAPTSAHLVIVAGPGEGAWLPLGPDQTLGRGASADLHLADPGASRVHARIRVTDGAAHVVDLGSKNGVRVNGDRIGRRPRPLRSGDRIAVGETVLAFTVPGDAAPATSPQRRRPGIAPARAWVAAALLLGAAAALVALSA